MILVKKKKREMYPDERTVISKLSQGLSSLGLESKSEVATNFWMRARASRFHGSLRWAFTIVCLQWERENSADYHSEYKNAKPMTRSAFLSPCLNNFLGELAGYRVAVS